MELLDSNAPGLIHLLAGPSGSHVYLKAVNLYIRLKGLVFLTHVHKTGNLQTRTKCFHFRLLYKQWVPLTPCKVEFPSLESMLFKQPSIWKNVLEGGSYPHFSSSRRGCWGGIGNPNRNSCETLKVGCRQRFGRWQGLCVHCPAAAQCPAEHHSQPSASQAAAGTPCRTVMEDSSSQEVLPFLKLSRWHNK